jgi:hypothetical protein
MRDFAGLVRRLIDSKFEFVLIGGLQERFTESLGFPKTSTSKLKGS